MYVEKFSTYLENENKSKNTIRNYINDIKQFFQLIGKDQLEALEKADIKNYLSKLNDLKLSDKTINRKSSAINQFIIFLNSKCDFNINFFIKKIKSVNFEFIDTPILSKEELEAIIEKAEEAEDLRAVAILYTLYLTGARVSEILQIKKKDVGKDEIKIVGKGNKPRPLFIHYDLTILWRKYLKVRTHKKEEALFTGERGAITRQTVWAIIQRYAAKAGIDLAKAHPHAIRHLYGYEAIEEGQSISELAKVLGHSNLNTTKIYTERPKEKFKSDLYKRLGNKIKFRK